MLTTLMWGLDLECFLSHTQNVGRTYANWHSWCYLVLFFLYSVNISHSDISCVKVKICPPLVSLFSSSIHQTVFLLFWKNWTWNKYNNLHRFIFHSLLNPTPIKMLLPFNFLNTKSLGISVDSYHLAALNIINQTSFINTLLLACLYT